MIIIIAVKERCRDALLHYFAMLHTCELDALLNWTNQGPAPAVRVVFFLSFFKSVKSELFIDKL